MIDKIVIELKEHEGFRGENYLDSLGKPTIGYGTLLPITKIEATLLLRSRLMQKENELENRSEIYCQAKEEVKIILLNMAYQLGVTGLLKFKKTFEFIKEHEFKKASIEMLDSRWAKQTPNRAKYLSEKMSKIT